MALKQRVYPPDPAHPCKVCAGPTELLEQTFTGWSGRGETSNFRRRCSDPKCIGRTAWGIQ